MHGVSDGCWMRLVPDLSAAEMLQSEHSLWLPRFWDSLNFKKDMEFVGITVLFLDEKFTPVGRANHYMPSLKAGSVVKVDHFEVARCSSMYKITDHPFLICFISLTIIAEVITGAPVINFQSRLDCSKSPSDCEHKRRTPRALTSPKKQLESLSVSSLIQHSLWLPRFWDSLNFKKDMEFVGITVLFLDEKFTPVGRANHYMPSLKAGSVVKVDHFEVARCSSMYKITDHPFLICFISLTIIAEVITGAPVINFQSRLDCSKSPSDCEHKRRTPRYIIILHLGLYYVSIS
uniref:DUF223 domain-containing protein n=1 Tax=Brassica oleracea var. oleracea TaxID=109376 RepID=A0A0D3CIF2_BRAOL